jgi:uncharacterized iron-regulated membrane protein
VKALLRQIHRYASLTLVTLWVIQALTGVLMVFHWELDDAGIAGEHRAFDADLLGARVEDLQATRPGQTVTSLYPTYLENSDGATDSVRVDGHGTILRERPLDHDFAHTGIIQAAVILHQSLFAGDRGRLFIGCSGLLLLSNLILGLTLAWPRVGQWQRALTPVKMRMSAALLYSCGSRFPP